MSVNFQGYSFKDSSLFETAMRHKSLLAFDRKGGSNERLEFIGDRILGLVIAEALYKKYSNEDEGLLAKRHSELVSSKSLLKVAEKINLKNRLKVSEELKRAKGVFGKPLANAVEALIGAVYLDSSFEVVKLFVLDLWSELLEEQVDVPVDFKTALQEFTQAEFKKLPSYEVLGMSGTDHNPKFEMEASIEIKKGQIVSAIGYGKNKKQSQMDSAKSLLEKLKK
ncbi:MAG: ribonuclease III [Alphaproteobacteria bacterium]|jgi:ribonuclease-3|nr:ribonuclease III [Alphaproteobacteria bacterium]